MKSPDLLEGCENFRCEIFRVKFLIHLLCSLRTKKGSPRASLQCFGVVTITRLSSAWFYRTPILFTTLIAIIVKWLYMVIVYQFV